MLKLSQNHDWDHSFLQRKTLLRAMAPRDTELLPIVSAAKAATLATKKALKVLVKFKEDF